MAFTGKHLSQFGHGTFIQFESNEFAERALKQMVCEQSRAGADFDHYVSSFGRERSDDPLVNFRIDQEMLA